MVLPWLQPDSEPSQPLLQSCQAECSNKRPAEAYDANQIAEHSPYILHLKASLHQEADHGITALCLAKQS